MAILGKGKITTQKQVSVSSTATKLLDPNPNRIRATFVNDSATEAYLGPDSTVTTSGTTGGIPAVQNAVIDDLDTNGSWYAIVSTGTATIRVTEVS